MVFCCGVCWCSVDVGVGWCRQIEERKMAESNNYKDNKYGDEMQEEKEDKKIIPKRKQCSLNIPINYKRRVRTI